MEHRLAQISWSARQRLEFIEFRLFWEGGLNRSEIVDRFGVSVPQASADLTAYKSLAGTNIEYNSSEKRYVAAPDFQPRLITPSGERYLTQLRAIADGIIGLQDTAIANPPNVALIPIPTRRIDAAAVRSLVKAIRLGKSIQVEYQSMNERRPDPIWREITPHAFGWDGFRWHARAFCHMEQTFKDFIVSRFLHFGELGVARSSASDDKNWNTFFDVVLIPNPRFSTSQKRTIELDYGMNGGKTVVRVRRALLYYFDKRLRLDVAEEKDRPKETPVVVENRVEYDEAIRSVAY